MTYDWSEPEFDVAFEHAHNKTARVCPMEVLFYPFIPG